jgi:hypothetical protein
MTGRDVPGGEMPLQEVSERAVNASYAWTAMH